MIFEQIAVGEMQNFCYLIGDEDSKEAAIVDPAFELGKLLEAAKKHDLAVKFILITHTHYDHVDGVKEMADATGAVVYVHKNGEEYIKNLGVGNLKTIDENDIINIGKIEVKVLHTPGHSPTNVCFMIDNKLITGDTLFVEGCGRVDLAGSDIKKQWNSLERIKNMDENIEIYPGHDYGSQKSSTIKHEKENNPYLKCNDFEEFSTIR
jgi:glyoxylase-like metal-dependent hydrolase (beta-lactamase superfamily II)|tara:strand:+ start:1331 stop:1954 length:624 start_codon:yes stop_codon:yes gene_type:complete